MTTDELNAIVQAVMSELEKAGVDFDFKAETPQADDLVYVMRGTADRYMGITVKWQNLLDIIVQKATEAKNEAVSAKDIALQTLATIQSIESNISTMKTSVETTKGEVETLKSDVATMKASVETSEANVASMKASVEASEANVTQMKSDVSTMKASVEGTKTEVEGLKGDVTNLKAQTQTIVDNAKEEVTGLLDTKVDYTDSLTYEQIMASTDLTNKVASASAVQALNANKFSVIYKNYEWQTTHTFTVNTRSIGLMYTDDGTLYNYVLWNLSDISLHKISGTNTMTATMDSGNITITMDKGRALIVVG